MFLMILMKLFYKSKSQPQEELAFVYTKNILYIFSESLVWRIDYNWYCFINVFIYGFGCTSGKVNTAMRTISDVNCSSKCSSPSSIVKTNTTIKWHPKIYMWGISCSIIIFTPQNSICFFTGKEEIAFEYVYKLVLYPVLILLVQFQLLC